MTEEELDAILAFYRSPAGQKDIAATKTTTTTWSQWLLSRQQAKVTNATNTYVNDLQNLLAEVRKTK